jgi:hypothetical protein
MDSEKHLDLVKFAPKRASKWYLIRILMYTIFLIVLGYLLVSQLNKVPQKSKQVEEIEGVTIETE